MTADERPALAGTCLGCGELVAADMKFCPHCGTRQVPDRPMSTIVLPEETVRLGRSVTAWLVVAVIVAATLIFVAGVLVGAAVESW